MRRVWIPCRAASTRLPSNSRIIQVWQPYIGLGLTWRCRTSPSRPCRKTSFAVLVRGNNPFFMLWFAGLHSMVMCSMTEVESTDHSTDSAAASASFDIEMASDGKQGHAPACHGNVGAAAAPAAPEAGSHDGSSATGPDCCFVILSRGDLTACPVALLYALIRARQHSGRLPSSASAESAAPDFDVRREPAGNAGNADVEAEDPVPKRNHIPTLRARRVMAPSWRRPTSAICFNISLAM